MRPTNYGRIDVFEAIKFDVRLHGARFIILEFAAATLIAVAFMLATLLRTPRSLLSVLTTLWLAGFALNALAVALLARHAARVGTETERSTRQVHLYALELIVMLLIPASVACVALLQWRSGELVGRS